MEIESMQQAGQRRFRELFGAAPDVEGFAPGRVNLIGEHTDYNGGHVFPCSLTKGTYGAVRALEGREVQCFSENFADLGVITFSLDTLTYDKADGWTNFVKGMLLYMQEQAHTISHGFALYVNGDIPNGAGLSSSASLEVLVGILVRKLYDLALTKVEIALLGQKTENRFLGVNSGIMDQFAIAMGERDHALFLDTNTLAYSAVPCDFKDYVLLIMNTNKRRELSDSKYNERRAQCEAALAQLQAHVDIASLGALTPEQFEAEKHWIDDETLQKRAKHAVYENQRTVEAVARLKADDLAGFAELMNESHVSLRDDYDVTGKELDTLVAAAWDEDAVLGARMTGAGMGGCAIALVQKDSVDAVQAAIQQRYRETIGHDATFYVAAIGPGAHILDAEGAAA